MEAHPPLIVILFGPTGSGKTTMFKKYFVSQEDFQHFDIDDYTYEIMNRKYNQGFINERKKTASPIKTLQEDYLTSMRGARIQLARDLNARIAAKKDLVIDIAGASSIFTKTLVNLIKSNKYRVVLYCTYGNSLDELQARVNARYEAGLQIPAPVHVLKANLADYQFNINALAKTLHDLIDEIVVLDTSSAEGKEVFSYKKAASECVYELSNSNDLKKFTELCEFMKGTGTLPKPPPKSRKQPGKDAEAKSSSSSVYYSAKSQLSSPSSTVPVPVPPPAHRYGTRSRTTVKR